MGRVACKRKLGRLRYGTHANPPRRGARRRERGESAVQRFWGAYAERQLRKGGRCKIRLSGENWGPKRAACDDVLKALSEHTATGRAWRDRATKTMSERPSVAEELERRPPFRCRSFGENADESSDACDQLAR